MGTTATYLDFLETTTSEDVTEGEALGLLNFALLFQEKAFVNDTPLGDSDLLIQSSLTKDRLLFTQVTEFLKQHILCAHFRSEVSIEGKTLYPGEEIFSGLLYEVWKQRETLLGHNRETAAFTCKIHDERRDQYHRELDKILRELPIVRYDPDEVKSRFREETRTLLQHSELLHTLTHSLPTDLQRQIQNALERPYFTLRDVYWPLHNQLQLEAQDLIRAFAFINLRSYATKALAAPLGAHQGGLALGELDLAIAADHRDVALAPPRYAPKSIKEFFESADIKLPMPSISLLAKLSPDQVLTLRVSAKATIFKTANNQDLLLSPKNFVIAYGKALREYVSIIDVNLARWYPDAALTPTLRSSAALGWGAVAVYAARECWSGRWDAAAVSVRSAVAQTPIIGQTTVAQTLVNRGGNMPRVVGATVGRYVGYVVGGFYEPSTVGVVAGGIMGNIAGTLAEQKIAHLFDYFMVLVCDRSKAANGIAVIPQTWDRHVHAAGLRLDDSEPAGHLGHS